MTATLKNLTEAVTLLPTKDRAYLAEKLLASLEETNVEEQWIQEAKRRCEEIVSGQVKPVPAEEVYRRIERLLKK